MSALNMDVKTHHPLGRLQPSQDCMFKRLKQKNIALVFMTKRLEASSWQSCVSGNPCGVGGGGQDPPGSLEDLQVAIGLACGWESVLIVKSLSCHLSSKQAMSQ